MIVCWEDSPVCVYWILNININTNQTVSIKSCHINWPMQCLLIIFIQISSSFIIVIYSGTISSNSISNPKIIIWYFSIIWKWEAHNRRKLMLKKKLRTTTWQTRKSFWCSSCAYLVLLVYAIWCMFYDKLVEENTRDPENAKIRFRLYDNGF